jgi:hypothetical protein
MEPEPKTPPTGAVTETRPCDSPECGGEDRLHWQPTDVLEPDFGVDDFPLSSPSHSLMAWVCTGCGAQSRTTE